MPWAAPGCFPPPRAGPFRRRVENNQPNRLYSRVFWSSVLWCVPQDVPHKALNEASIGDGWSPWVWCHHRTQHLLATAFLVWTFAVLGRHGVPHGFVDAPWPSPRSLGMPGVQTTKGRRPNWPTPQPSRPVSSSHHLPELCLNGQSLQTTCYPIPQFLKDALNDAGFERVQ